MARNERSAGFVVFRGARPPQFLLLDYGQHWDYPKGHVEKGEDDLTAARRELMEETGLTAPRQLPRFQHEISYFFRDRRDRQLIRKTVVFFLAEVGEEPIKLSHEHVGYAFLPFDEALARLTYPSAKELLRRAQDHLKNLAPPT